MQPCDDTPTVVNELLARLTIALAERAGRGSTAGLRLIVGLPFTRWLTSPRQMGAVGPITDGLAGLPPLSLGGAPAVTVVSVPSPSASELQERLSADALRHVGFRPATACGAVMEIDWYLVDGAGSTALCGKARAFFIQWWLVPPTELLAVLGSMPQAAQAEALASLRATTSSIGPGPGFRTATKWP